jgi:sugar phosphate isomerase/epimerase
MFRFAATVTAQYDTPVSPFPASAFDAALDWLAADGFDAAEICICDYNGIDVPTIQEKLKVRGLGCSTISTGQARAREGIALAGVAADKVQAAQKRLREHIDAAAILGSYVTVGFIRGTGSINELAESLFPCLEYAAGKGVCLLIEPMNRYETNLINTAAEAMACIRRLGNPDNLGILWDLFHANIEDGDWAACVAGMGPWLKKVHIADSNRAFPGFGHIDFGAIPHILRDAGFNGWLSFECHNKPSVEYVKQNAAGFVNAARGMLRTAAPTDG